MISFIKPENSPCPDDWFGKEFLVSEYDSKFKELHTNINVNCSDPKKEACEYYDSLKETITKEACLNSTTSEETMEGNK